NPAEPRQSNSKTVAKNMFTQEQEQFFVECLQYSDIVQSLSKRGRSNPPKSESIGRIQDALNQKFSPSRGFYSVKSKIRLYQKLFAEAHHLHKEDPQDRDSVLKKFQFYYDLCEFYGESDLWTTKKDQPRQRHSNHRSKESQQKGPSVGSMAANENVDRDDDQNIDSRSTISIPSSSSSPSSSSISSSIPSTHAALHPTPERAIEQCTTWKETMDVLSKRLAEVKFADLEGLTCTLLQ
ncbi:hypothetical protein BGW38_010132, partial [Lunasporangiospora selenospora]